AADGVHSVSFGLSQEIQAGTGIETRTMAPGHYLRGGSPSAYDRILTTQFGVYAAELICAGVFGVTVAKKDGVITHNALADVAGKAKPVPLDHPLIDAARSTGVCLGD
ncbi:MAG: 6-phosphofructokinase, partial [Oscillospiraceae bacterium]|nr:6-phosphofructokinase [Oscillospiraceae bacterium]